MLAEIITIGDEILIGQTVDTNSAWLGKELNKRGIDIDRISSIRDTEGAIHSALEAAEKRADIILLTGGLGPTNDDITKESLAKYFKVRMRRDTEALRNIEERFAKRGIELLDINRAQADLPENCTAIPNRKGTAPGMLFRADKKIIVSMPGVPYEMKDMMLQVVLPLIEKTLVRQNIVHHTITVIDIPESILSHRLRDIEAGLPAHIKLAYLPHLNLVRLRLTGKTEDLPKKELQEQVDEQMTLIKAIVNANHFDGDRQIAEVVGILLKEHGQTLSCVESCTGGYISHKISLIPGASAYFTGSFITYSNQYKIDHIGVSEALFTTVGSVSQEVAFEMASKGRKKLGTDYCIGVTGIAGPTGATETKEVGLVYIGLAKPDGTTSVTKYQFRGNRAQNIERTAYAALDLLRLELTQ